MYTFGQTVLALGFAATFMSKTFRPKVFTEKAPHGASYQGYRGQTLERRRVFGEEIPGPMRHAERARPPKSRPLCNVLFHDKLGSGQHYAHEFSGRVPFDLLD